MIRVFDAFSGIGGFRSAFERVGGFKTVGWCEIDRFAQKSYRALFDTGGEQFYENIRDIDTAGLADFDLLVGGFPCQPFSVAGKRLGTADERGDLFFELARILEAKRPRYFIFENVPGLLGIEKGQTFKVILETLSELGYCVEWLVHDSAGFGVPQSRKRVYLAGCLGVDCSGKILAFGNCDEENSRKVKQLIGGSQGQRVYAPDGLAVTQCSGSGGMGGKTGLYLIDMNYPPTLTEKARCITARQDSGVSKHKGEHSAVFCDLNENPQITLTTDENGYAESDLLYLGKYEVKETMAPYGYVQNAVSETVELTYAGQEIEVRDTVNQAFVNNYQEVEITLSKFMEYDELFGLGENDEYRYVRFGLFADEVITAADGSVIPENGMITEVSLTEDMTAKFDAQLPFGRYYVQEIATDEHYMLNGEKYLVNFEYMGQEMTAVNIDCGTFENHLKRGNANGYKVNEDDEPLANALFGLFAVGTETFTADTAIKTAVSDETGYFEFTEIPYGEYVICEIQAPDGYILSDEKFPVTVSENGETITIRTENKPITVEISKQDIYGEELAGAEMQLIDSEGNVVDEWVSDGTNHVVTELPVGKYVLKEIAAPDGYIIATDISFEVFADGSAVVENVEATATTEDGHPLIVMVDDTTKVEISKLDITNDEELVGATLQIIDEDGVVVEEWVSYEHLHFIEAQLIAGKTYTLKETIAPDGYTIANSIEFTVNEDGTVNTVVMYDEPIPDTPDVPDIPTGDTTSRMPGILMIAAGLVMVLIAGMGRKKKDDADDYAALCPDFIESEE